MSAAVQPLTHLHVHSHYTLLGATAALTDLVAQAKGDGLTHLALTDTNVLYGAVEFAQACTKARIQPLLGMMVQVAVPGALGFAETPRPEPIVLLATGPDGYRSLCRLSSLIQANPEREQLRGQGIAWNVLKAHRTGLLCLAGGRRSYLEWALRAGDLKAANSYLSRIGGLFDEQAYLALELHQPGDHKIAQAVSKSGERFGLPCVAVQPIYCLAPAEQSRLRLLAAIDHNCKVDEVPAAALPDEGEASIGLHWLSPAELSERFAAFPAALTAIEEIVDQCKPALPDGRPIWPVLKLPAEQTPEQALTAQAETGLKTQYVDQITPMMTQRLAAELAIINQQGFAPLFLLVADIVRFARAQQIPVSTRGSVANSLVAYCIGITTVDPILHDLLFERFLNPARSNPPDIDLDFCSLRRDEVLAYVRQTYGVDKVALVATVSTMRPRSAVGETAKAYGLDEEAVAKLVKLLPDTWHPDPRRRVHSALDELIGKLETPEQREIVTAAFALLGQPHHLSIHPGGLVVTPGALTDVVPVQWTPKGFLITQFDHEHVEAIGLPKIDLLGIRALTVLATTTKLVQQHYDSTFQLEKLPLDDPATAALLASGETVGVFQCESNGARRTLRQLKTRTVQDLAVANAFFKPGPATGGMAASFVRRYRGEEATRYLHPALEPILGFTQGVLIFQEQILRVARDIAGLSWAEADYLRKGMSKFQPQTMAAMQARFIAGCQRPAPSGPGFAAEQANTLWEQVQAFAGYGFNQGHATAYADVSYRSAYLKTHWPAAFLAARLANFGGFHHPAIYIAEALHLGIRVRPPHVNQSEREFTLRFERDATGAKQPVLWMGLGQVRSLRHASANAITQRRQEQPFASLADLCARVPLHPKELAHLIQCGALDSLGESRAALLADAKGGRQASQLHQLAFDFAETQVAAESAAERLTWERRILGLPVSVHPLATVQLPRRGLTPLARVPTLPGQMVKVAVSRLPGWTGGKGFFVGDGQTYLTAISAKQVTNPKVWTPVLLTGRWQRDEWAGGWFQVEAVEALEIASKD